MWNAATVTGTGTSGAVNIGPQTNVALFIKSSGAATFKLQCGASLLMTAGANDMANVSWYDYIRSSILEDNDGAAGTSPTIVLGAGDAVCIDLSPFAPTFLRLVRTDAGADSTVTAYSVAVG